MNKDRARRLGNFAAEVRALIESFEAIRDEEQEAFDNLPENFQDGDKGAEMQDYVDRLEEALAELDTGISAMEEIAMERS